MHVIYSIIYCSSFGSIPQVTYFLYWISSEHMCASHTEQILLSFGLTFWLGGKKTPFFLHHSEALTENFTPAPASLTPNLCPALLQPCTGVPFLSQCGPTNLSHCLSLPSKPFMPVEWATGFQSQSCICGNQTNLPFLEVVAALNLHHWCSSSENSSSPPNWIFPDSWQHIRDNSQAYFFPFPNRK